MGVTPPVQSDAALLGDRVRPAESFSKFYRRHDASVVSFCERHGLSAHDAADVSADVFLAAMVNRYKFDAGRGESAAPWLYAIATNVIAGRHRRSARERAANERAHGDQAGPGEPDLATHTELRDEVDRALAAIGELPAAERSAVMGRYLSDAEYHRLASEAGVSEQAVRQRVSRALANVRRQLDASE
jgi:RNA polymerase sigma factor (sigma-70 family)